MLINIKLLLLLVRKFPKNLGTYTNFAIEILELKIIVHQ